LTAFAALSGQSPDGLAVGKRRNKPIGGANFSGFAQRKRRDATGVRKFAGSKAVALYSRGFFGEMLLSFDPGLRRPKKLLRKVSLDFSNLFGLGQYKIYGKEEML